MMCAELRAPARWGNHRDRKERSNRPSVEPSRTTRNHVPVPGSMNGPLLCPENRDQITSEARPTVPPMLRLATTAIRVHTATRTVSIASFATSCRHLTASAGPSGWVPPSLTVRAGYRGALLVAQRPCG
jgi:hypothetical protein